MGLLPFSKRTPMESQFPRQSKNGNVRVSLPSLDHVLGFASGCVLFYLVAAAVLVVPGLLRAQTELITLPSRSSSQTSGACVGLGARSGLLTMLCDDLFQEASTLMCGQSVCILSHHDIGNGTAKAAS